MILTVDITDESGKVIVHQERDDSEFYLGMIDENGQYSSIGRAKPGGKGFIASIRKYAQEWAKEQDLDGFFQELRDMLIRLAVGAGDEQAKLYFQADTFVFNADELRAIMRDVKKEVASSFKGKLGEEGGVIFFHVTWEMLNAMIARLKKEIRQVFTVWEYPTSAIGKNEIEAILGWLFRR